jgi:thiamine biosynthesis protein ThiS
MAVEITLFGFGDDCPPGFNNNTRQINPGKNEGLEQVLKMAGFDHLEGLVVLINNQGIPQQDWPKTRVQDNDSIKVLSAVEGG